MLETYLLSNNNKGVMIVRLKPQNRSKQPTQKVPMVGFFTLPLKMKRDPASPNQE